MSLLKYKFVDHTLDLVPTTIKAADQGDQRIVEGIASTIDVDRMGDVVDPKGMSFQLPLPLLFSHDSRDQIGQVTALKVEDNQIFFKAVFFNENTSTVTDMHWRELKQGGYRGVSIGFQAKRTAATDTGLHYLDWELLEISLVSIAANPNARVTTVKSFPVPVRTPSAPGRATPAAHAGASAARTRTKTMNTAAKKRSIDDQLADLEQRSTELRASITELTTRELDDDVRLQLDEANEELEEVTADLERLTKSKSAVGARLEPAGTVVRSRQPTEPVDSSTATQPRAPSNIIHMLPKQKAAAPGDLLIKSATVAFLAHVQKRPFEQVLRERYPGNQVIDIVTRAAVAPADTVTPGWAAELVAEQTADFLDSIKDISVYSTLAAKGVRVTFGRAGKIRVPGRDYSKGRINGDFVGEGQPIPVRKAGITGVTLQPHKAAVISEFTRELAMHSTPSIEALIRQIILEDTAETLDMRLLDNAGGTAVRPPGLANGVTPVNSTGNSAANIAADLKAAAAAAITAKFRRPVWLLNPLRALGLATVTTATGEFVYKGDLDRGVLFGFEAIVSMNVPEDQVFLVDAASFATATGDSPEFDVSDVATVHEEDTNPLPITTTDGTTVTAAAPVRSFWQTASIGIRMLLDVTWGLRRPGTVFILDNVAW